MKIKLAPIGLSTYSRLQHLQQAVAALQKNTLAAESELYVFSDAPKPGDEEKVRAVRKYLHTITGFKQVHIRERTSNSRIANSRGGIEELLEAYGKVIFLEEDVVTAPGFLQFMNDALEFYKDNDKIGCISAYCPPLKMPDTYKNDVFALTRMDPWGVALWKRYYRFNTPISETEYLKLFSDSKKIKALGRSVGQEAIQFIKMDFEGKLNAGDMRSIFWQFVEGKLTIYPRKSLVRNTGQDGSGFHMGSTNKWDVSELWDKLSDFKFIQDIGVEEGIRQAHYDFYKIHETRDRLIKVLQSIRAYQYLRPVVKKIQKMLLRHPS